MVSDRTIALVLPELGTLHFYLQIYIMFEKVILCKDKSQLFGINCQSPLLKESDGLSNLALPMGLRRGVLLVQLPLLMGTLLLTKPVLRLRWCLSVGLCWY